MLADDIYELHHVVPQFMTGWTRGRAVVLTKKQHDRYHVILDRVLEGGGMPKMREGKEAWFRFIQDNPQRLNEVRGALVESVEQFAKEPGGVDMWADLVTELTRQGFAIR